MGGSQYQVKCLLDELLPMDRYDVFYLANRTSPDFVHEKYPVITIGKSVPRLGYLVHTAPLCRALRKIRPDVIYQRVACGYTGIAAYYASQHDVRLIWHVAHDSDVSSASSIHGRNPVRRFLEQKSVNFGIRHATHIVTQTEHQATLLKKNYNREADAVVPNFHPHPRENIEKSGPLSVVWVANLKPWKQPEAFIRLAQALSDIEGVSFTMAGALMAGPGEKEWADRLLCSIDEAPNLRYLGQLNQDEVNELLSRAHIFVNTSLEEGFPNTFIQAWMRRVPVVSLHVNPDRVFDHERVGIHAKSAEELNLAVRRLLSDPRLREEYARTATEYAGKKHSSQNARILGELIDSGSVSSVDGPDPRAGTSGRSGRTGSHPFRKGTP